MAKKIKQGSGMMERDAIQYDLTGAGGEGEARALVSHLDRFFAGYPSGGIDGLRDENAKVCRGILEKAGADHKDMDIEMRFGDDSAQWIAAQWLTEYGRLNGARARLEKEPNSKNIETVVHLAEELGRLQERMWWRRGVDRQAGKRREALAISGRKQVKGGKDGNAMRTDTSFRAMRGVEAQAYANDLHNRQPSMTWAAIRNAVAKRFNVSAETVKKALVNPKKHG